MPAEEIVSTMSAEQSAFDKYLSAHDRAVTIGEAIIASKMPITVAEVKAFIAANAERKVALTDLSSVGAFETDMRLREART